MLVTSSSSSNHFHSESYFDHRIDIIFFSWFHNFLVLPSLSISLIPTIYIIKISHLSILTFTLLQLINHVYLTFFIPLSPSLSLSLLVSCLALDLNSCLCFPFTFLSIITISQMIRYAILCKHNYLNYSKLVDCLYFPFSYFQIWSTFRSPHTYRHTQETDSR